MRSGIVLFAVVMLAAGCGGGGGGSAAPTYSAVTTVGPPPLSQNTSVQRSVVQQTLTTTSETPTIASYAGVVSGAGVSLTLAVARRAFADRRTGQSTSPCENGEIVTSTSGSGSSVAFTIDQYYDTACTTLWWVGAFTGTETLSTIAFTGSYTYYTRAGVVYEYVSPASFVLNSSGATAYVSIGGTIAPSLTAAPVLALGLGCSITTGSASCSIAAAEHLTSLGLDQAQSANATATVTSGASSSTLTLSGTGSSYSGSLNALNVASQGTYLWSVTGGSPTVSVSLNGTATYASGVLSTLTCTVTDSADAASASIAYNAATQLYTGTVTPTSGGASVASFSVSATGTGTLTYGNGTVASVVNWVVQS